MILKQNEVSRKGGREGVMEGYRETGIQEGIQRDREGYRE